MADPTRLEIGPLSIAPGEISRGADRLLALIRESDDPDGIVATLGSPDLLLLLRSADEAERAELLALASSEQVREVVDLCCWRRDRFRGETLEELLRPLVAEGYDGATKALRDLDDEIRFMLLRRHVMVHLRENRDDEFFVADTSETIESPDGFYLVELPDPDAAPDLIRRLFQAMFLDPFSEYQPELEALRHELPSETEERALTFRRGRMADLGFGTREEGLALLSPRDPAEARRLAEHGPPVPPVPADLALPLLYRGGLAGSALLDATLARVRELADDPAGMDERRRRKALSLDAELGAMTSLLLGAMDCDPGDPGDLARLAIWARDLLTLGLEATFDGDAEAAAAGLLSQAPGLFVQAAMGMLAPLRARARVVLADARLASGKRRAGLLDPPLLVAVEAAAPEIPSRWPPLEDGLELSCAPLAPLAGELAPFSSRDQVRRVERLIEEAEIIAEVLVGKLGWRPEGEAGATASQLLMNAMAHAFRAGEPRPAPLPVAEAGSFIDHVLATGEEELLGRTMALFDRVTTGSDPLGSGDALTRMLARLTLIGRARLAGGEPPYLAGE